jgi:hypothetical protein
LDFGFAILDWDAANPTSIPVSKRESIEIEEQRFGFEGQKSKIQNLKSKIPSSCRLRDQTSSRVAGPFCLDLRSDVAYGCAAP